MMKKLALLKLTCFLLLLHTSLFAQEFNYGIVGGLDIAKTRLLNIPDDNNSTQIYPIAVFNINGHFGYKSAGFWGFSIEPGFIQKGWKFKFNFNDEITEEKIKLNYIQIPFLADFYISNKFFISVGPELAYLINNKFDVYDNLELSAMAGINYSLHKNFDIGLRYNHGITSTSSIEWTDTTGLPIGESNEYNQYLQVFGRFKI